MTYDDAPGWAHTGAGDTEIGGAVFGGKNRQHVTPAIVLLLKEHGKLSDHELTQLCIERGIGSSCRTSIGARRKELVNDGLVRDSGERAPSPYKRNGAGNVQWELTPDSEVEAEKDRQAITSKAGLKLAIAALTLERNDALDRIDKALALMDARPDCTRVEVRAILEAE